MSFLASVSLPSLLITYKYSAASALLSHKLIPSYTCTVLVRGKEIAQGKQTSSVHFVVTTRMLADTDCVPLFIMPLLRLP